MKKKCQHQIEPTNLLKKKMPFDLEYVAKNLSHYFLAVTKLDPKIKHDFDWQADGYCNVIHFILNV